MRIGDTVFVHGIVDEIRKDTVIIRNNGGYFGTVAGEIITGDMTGRKKGKWIPQDHNKITDMASTLVFYYPKCSECGHSGNYTNFCPRCGADMRGDDHDKSK